MLKLHGSKGFPRDKIIDFLILHARDTGILLTCKLRISPAGGSDTAIVVTGLATEVSTASPYVQLQIPSPFWVWENKPLSMLDICSSKTTKFNPRISRFYNDKLLGGRARVPKVLILISAQHMRSSLGFLVNSLHFTHTFSGIVTPGEILVRQLDNNAPAIFIPSSTSTFFRTALRDLCIAHLSIQSAGPVLTRIGLDSRGYNGRPGASGSADYRSAPGRISGTPALPLRPPYIPSSTSRCTPVSRSLRKRSAAPATQSSRPPPPPQLASTFSPPWLPIDRCLLNSSVWVVHLDDICIYVEEGSLAILFYVDSRRQSMNGSVVMTASLSPTAKSTDLPESKQGKRGYTRDVAAPNGTVMAAVSSETLAVVGEPDGGVVVLGAGEEQISFSVVLEEKKLDSIGETEQKNPNCSSTSPLEEERWKTKI
nr:hypothetical protein DVH24_042731 [Ipomoea batatas]